MFGKLIKPCKECKHCDIENKKCYPKSRDCRKEYDLTDDDINNSVGSCDFFEAVKVTKTM